jgi:thiamine-phosphate pyrophosphorylase
MTNDFSMKLVPDYSLYLVTDSALAGARGVEAVVQAAVAGGATIVQWREKSGDSRALPPRVQRLREWLRLRHVPFIVNDNVDLALACDADGVHVGQDDLPCAEVRRRVGAERLIGVSVSTVAEAIQAARDGADYLGVSPVFATPTKPDAPAAAGLDGLRAIRAAVQLPLVAIGGIHAGNAAAVRAAGADGIAVVSAILTATDPCAAAQALRAACESPRQASQSSALQNV